MRISRRLMRGFVRGKAVAIRLRGPKCDDLASKNERAEGHSHPNKRVWLAGFGLRVSLVGSNVARGDCFGERSLVVAKLRRTLDVRLATARVFGPRFFCGHYVLVDCTDETSAETHSGIFVNGLKSNSHPLQRPRSRVAVCLCLAVRCEFDT